MIAQFLFSLVFAALQASADAQAADEPEAGPAPGSPVVVELFTSQGCTMCPDANAFLGELGRRDGVIAIAYGVGIWDGLGWSDTYAEPAFNARQEAYVEAGEARRVYTPHFVVNGHPEMLRYPRERIQARIDAAEPLSAEAVLSRDEDGVVAELAGAVSGAPAQVWLVAYEPGASDHQITDGPNAGKVVTHNNMATALTRLGDWPGGEARFHAPEPEPGLALAVLVQAGPGGEILAAAALGPQP